LPRLFCCPSSKAGLMRPPPDHLQGQRMLLATLACRVDLSEPVCSEHLDETNPSSAPLEGTANEPDLAARPSPFGGVYPERSRRTQGKLQTAPMARRAKSDGCAVSRRRCKQTLERWSKDAPPGVSLLIHRAALEGPMKLIDEAADTGDHSAARRHPDERAQLGNSAVVHSE